MTPMKDEMAIVIVEIGPASDIGMFKLSANKVGSQFLVAQPGSEVDAKKKRMTQKAMFEKTIAKPFMIGILATGATGASGFTASFSSSRFS